MSVKKIGVFGLVMINLIAIDSLRNIPLTAPSGLSIIWLYIAGTLVFFIPCAIAIGELTSKWPVMGGLSVWVGEAYGPDTGFFVVWLQWIYNLAWFPSITAFASTHLAYGWTFTWGRNFIDLSNNPIFLTVLCIVLFWGATVVNCFGMKTASILSTIGTLCGTMLPMILIIMLGVAWVLTGHEISLFSTNFSYDQGSLMGLMVVVLFSLMGLEIASAHAAAVKNPQKNYPIALWLTVVLVPLSLVLSNLAIGLVIPPNKIDPRAGLIDSFAIFFNTFHLPWMKEFIAFSLFIGAFGAIGAWSFGLSRYLNRISEHGFLPRKLAAVNRNFVPQNAMIFQAVIVTILSMIYLWMPSIQAAYWYLSCLTAQLALVAYIIFFCAAIKLRLKNKWDKKTEYVFGPAWSSILFYVIGIIGSLCGFIAGFMLPGNETMPLLKFDILLAAGIVLTFIIPFLIMLYKKCKSGRKAIAE